MVSQRQNVQAGEPKLEYDMFGKLTDTYLEAHLRNDNDVVIMANSPPHVDVAVQHPDVEMPDEEDALFLGIQEPSNAGRLLEETSDEFMAELADMSWLDQPFDDIGDSEQAVETPRQVEQQHQQQQDFPFHQPGQRSVESQRLVRLPGSIRAQEPAGHISIPQAAELGRGQQTAGLGRCEQTAGPSRGQQTSGPSRGQQAAGHIRIPQAAGLGRGQQTAGLGHCEQTAGPSRGQQAAGPSRGQQAAGHIRIPQAAGLGRGQQTAGLGHCEQTAGPSRGQQAAGPSRPPQAAGYIRIPQAAGLGRGQQTAGLGHCEQTAGPSRGQQAAGPSRPPQAAGYIRIPQAAGPSRVPQPVGSSRVQRFKEPFEVRRTLHDIPEPQPLERQLTVATSGLAPGQLRQVLDMVSMAGGRIVSKVGADVTHLIVNITAADNLITFKYLQAIARKIWIVRAEWARQCVDSKSLVPEDHFEASNFLHCHPGGKISRLSSESLFAGYNFFIENTLDTRRLVSCSLIELNELLTTLGGTVFATVGEMLENRSIIDNMVAVVTDFSDSYKCTDWIMADIKVVQVDWIQRCILAYRIQL